jgi:hypothetical protein
MQGDERAARDGTETVRLALQGWQQRIYAVIEIARDSDDLAVRLPVLDELAHELVADLERAMHGLDAAAQVREADLPRGADVLRVAVGKAHAQLSGIELWHRGPSVGALRKARDGFLAALERLDR